MYKYRDWNNKQHQKLITRQEVYFPKPSQFNDPFDGNIPIRGDLITYEECLEKNLEILNILHHDKDQRLVREEAKEITDGKTLWHPENTKKESEERIKKWDSIIGLFSLSELNDNILMWSHYSNNHNGFVVGFDTELLISGLDFDFIDPIKYQLEYPIIKGTDDTTFHKKFFYKSSLWSYEHEWRITKNHIKNRVIKIKVPAIIEIIIGCNTQEKNKMEIIKMAKSKLSPNIQIFQAKKMEGYFNLEITILK